MITGIGSVGTARTVDVRAETVARGASAPAADVKDEAQVTAPASAAAAMAAQGAPVDTDKVAALRARIASGSYTVDPDAIAAHMIALDLPTSL